MRWSRGMGGGQVEDRRGLGGGAAVGGGLGIIGLILTLLLGGNPLGGGGGGGTGIDVGPQLDPFNRTPSAERTAAPPPQDDLAQFVGFVVDDVQDLWAEAFRAAGQRYQPTTLVLFEQATQSACGGASSDIGPHYCPADQKVYLDLSFFRELRSRFGAPGDFAQAYVIAHEFGHHVQHVLGVDAEVRRAQQRDRENANEYSVRLELQADCFAGVWGHSAQREGLLEAGDVEEGIEAAAAVGDDRIQRSAGGRVNPETWTHGSSAQRVEWFRRGFEAGDPEVCDTFS